MTQILQHIIRIGILVVTWIFFAVSCSGQHEQKAYYFEGEEVVFVFDIRNYTKALLGENALSVDFVDLGIHEVAITGEFNNWSKKGWKMTKRDEFTYELRKRIEG